MFMCVYVYIAELITPQHTFAFSLNNMNTRVLERERHDKTVWLIH